MTGYCDDCGNTACICLTEQQSKQAERKELFKQVALRCIRYSENCNEFTFYKQNADDIFEIILTAGEKFSKKENHE